MELTLGNILLLSTYTAYLIVSGFVIVWLYKIYKIMQQIEYRMLEIEIRPAPVIQQPTTRRTATGVAAARSFNAFVEQCEAEDVPDMPEPAEPYYVTEGANGAP